MGLISTSEAAERLGVHITRVQVLIREGRLPAQKIGGTYVVDEDDLKLVADRKPGRPRKGQAEKVTKQVLKQRNRVK
jgi:excisionase family DNA binding protein